MILSESGIFESIINNTNSCDSIITLELTVNQPADGISLGDDIQVDLGQTIDIVPEFTGQGLTEIMWLDESGTIIGEDIELLDVKPIEDTFFEVFALDANGCDAYDIIHIDVDINIDIYIPNVFSPELHNSDSKFSVSFNEAVEGIKSVLIYDRWGALVYELNSSENFGYEGWDGTYNGRDLENGVYTYIMVFDIIDGSEVKKSGSITKL
jgi:gliding motility-associated-like protein